MRADLPDTMCSCERCQEDLAAFIDAEAANPAMAARSYPHVWWHILACAECAATYEAVQFLFEAQIGGQISPLLTTLRQF
ncbi:hypothetical protein HC891_01775 [Candidatus Gracilibacteria bacterium]|nr:hypothetical protein [Candidatus Gracilibacteria bacterium]